MNMFIGMNGHHVIVETKENTYTQGETRLLMTACGMGKVPVSFQVSEARKLGEWLIEWANQHEGVSDE